MKVQLEHPADEIKRPSTAALMIWPAFSLFLPCGVAANPVTSLIRCSTHSFACSIWTLSM